jgi:hypothetical protein
MSQRVWSCQCGWRSTAENVEGRGRKGEAPPHCRRCHSKALRVTSETHPKITHVCKGCREDFIGHVGATLCKKCRIPVSRKQAWDGRRKYVWTLERDQLLRDHYNHNATAIAARYFPGWPKWAIVKRAADLGLCRTKEKPWTKGEDAFIREHAGERTAQWMSRQIRRTTTAIVVRLKRLQISRRIQADGMTMGQLEKALGIDHRVIAGWARSGRLKGTWRANANEHERWEFQEPDVADFILAYPSAFRLDRVEPVWFMSLMREAVERSKEDRAAAPRKERKTKAVRPPAAAATIEPRPCEGIDGEPCEFEKSVMVRAGIPARCPDCTLAFKRQLQREDMQRLKRIRAARPPHLNELSRRS